MAEETEHDIIIRYFGEVPNQSAAVAALALYLTISLIILAITCRARAWFMLTVVLTGLLEAAGFLSRVIMLHSPSYIGYVLMQCFLIISPVLLAIVEYICLGKMVAMSKTGRDSRLMRWQSRIFALTDAVCLCIQGSAGAMLSSKDPDTSLHGRRLMLIGLAAQLGFFTCFTCLCAYVQRSPQYGLGQLSPARHVFGTRMPP
ncbi:hypothetical protein Vafri_19452 [Volvox africanus]|uniref:Uncharacterized protein n=1 Tax=Volvox africanus TaxID=51714 RepID=A0A8J4BQC4_9CHLO|nr:hypothetical protein Vafri_19452 [Volvox africanus]